MASGRTELEKYSLLKRNSRHQSRYCVIQFIYDATYTLGKLCGSVWKAVAGGEGDRSECRELLRGVFRTDNGLSATQARVGGIVAALVMVNLTGALFTISPSFLAVLAAALGWIWPTWISELLERTSVFFEETRARGRGEDPNKTSAGGSRPSQKSSGQYDKNRYHFFRSLNGKSNITELGSLGSVVIAST